MNATLFFTNLILLVVMIVVGLSLYVHIDTIYLELVQVKETNIGLYQWTEKVKEFTCN
jgi:hypothetical protein